MSDPLPIILPQDTPIRRACLADMTPEQIEQAIDTFRERRMRAYTAYQEALRMKDKIKAERDAATVVKRIEQLEKLFKTLDNSLDKAGKYIAEIKVLAITSGTLGEL